MRRCLLLLVALIGATGQHYNQRGGQQQPARPNIDPYAVLGISRDATPMQIKTAYRKLSLKYHPDKNKDADAKAKMTEVGVAYEMIADPDKKLIFDEFGSGEKFYNKWQYEETQRRKGKKVSTKDFYTESEDVATLTIKNFYQSIKPKGMLVEFYAPWCVHCQDMVSEYKKAAILLEDIMPLGAVNCETNKKLCGQQGIHSFPTMKLFMPVDAGQEQAAEEYSEDSHDADVIYSFVKQSMSNALVELGADNWKQVNDGSMWLVDFSAGQWCGPCVMLKKFVRKTAAQLEGTAKVGIINCDIHKDHCANLGITYYPQLRLFSKDKTSASGEVLESNHNFPAVNTLNLFQTMIKIMAPPGAGAVDGDGTSHEEL